MGQKNGSTVLLLVVSMMGFAASSVQYHAPSKHQGYKQAPRPYSFDYAVQDKYSGNDYNRQEYSDGNNVQGSYSVQLPDGRKQTVKYAADHYNGFQADVSYYGKAQFPHKVGKPFIVKPNHYKPEPSYKPQRPVYKPQPTYHQPAPVYHEPEPIYHPQPKPTYHQPEPSYHAPQPTYHQPEPSYHQPEPTYHQPEPTYHQPEPTYHQPEPTYHQPEPTYHQPEPVYH